MLIPSLTVAMMQSAERVEVGTRLYHSCQAAVRYWDGDKEQDPLRIAECVAYVDGFVDGHSINAGRSFCIGSATTGAMVRVYLNYMIRNPKLLDADRWDGLSAALQDSYPCPVKK